MMFQDRADAGKRLAEKLAHLKDRKPVVLALPRGGVPVGFEVARALDAPLDVLLVRKIGVPWQPELALGAVTDGEKPETFIDKELAKLLAISDDYVKEETARQVEELERRRRVYCAGRAPVDIAGATAIVVDDGIATGATMRVALQAARKRNPARLVLATPVAAADTIAKLRPLADEVVCVETPAGLGAIGFYYADFHQLSDDEVTAILTRAAETAGKPETATNWRNFLAHHLRKPDRGSEPARQDHNGGR
jgi:putative phosphoribosyl transferase